MKYKVTHYMQHTEVAVVEAKDIHDAYRKVMFEEFTSQNDEAIIDQDCEKIYD